MRRLAKLLVALLVVGASVAVVLWNSTAETAPPALSVADAKRNAAPLEGRDVTVRGSVVEGTIVMDGGRVAAFVMGDIAEKISVHYNRTPPDNFGSKEVVVHGSLHVGSDGVPWLEATTIQVGCASKY